jgi:hypothetical protein
MELETQLKWKENYEQIALLEAVGELCGNRKLKRAVKKFAKSMKNLQKVIDKQKQM